MALLQAIGTELQVMRAHSKDFWCLWMRAGLELRNGFALAVLATWMAEVVNRWCKILHRFDDYTCLLEGEASANDFLH